MTSRLRRLPLRSRLALLTAVAVAVAVAVAAFACWFLTRQELTSALDQKLRDSASPDRVQRLVGLPCSTKPQTDDHLGPGAAWVQFVDQDGRRCVIGPKAVNVTDQDIAVADGRLQEVTRDGTTTSGQAVRVYTQQMPVRVDGGRGVLTVSVSRPLDEVTGPLNTLALVMLLVTGGGVVGAGAAGLWIARTGLKPVDRLTEAVEHVARTEDLAVRIPAEGDDEIARLSRSFNSMTAALASSRERQQQLIADAGHELRTPLTSLRTNIELLARSEETGRPLPPDDRKALMASVKAQMTELAALIGDLQELARPDVLPGTGPPQVVAVHEVAKTALKRARLRGADLTIDASLSPWYARGEPAALERALVNLLDNAVKFSPSGGVIEVVLKDGDFTVRDHGPGIPADELPHVFERFWRSPSARALPGSGLGLSIVARTVQQSGGQVGLRPAPGGGTVAWIRLPGAPTEPPELPESPEPPELG
ncbi:HAMP domain-containing sensor histidine kinase [Streptomyces sparsogenes]|uniref:sensor histidine kinase n=1 Tax=Streptomyces sparsogenes TaxID=67365 RepID=UPI0033D0325B